MIARPRWPASGILPLQPATPMKFSFLLRPLAVIALAIGTVSPLVATNGMNMEGYGPVATALGGASFAYDNGPGARVSHRQTNLQLMYSRHF